MTRAMGWVIAGVLVAWALPASADVANDDCGSKEVGDSCEDYMGDTGVCAEDDDDQQIYCDTTAEPVMDGGSGTSGGTSGGASGASAGASDDDDDDDGCSVGRVGSGAGGEVAGLGALLLICIAFRKRFD